VLAQTSIAAAELAAADQGEDLELAAIAPPPSSPPAEGEDLELAAIAPPPSSPRADQGEDLELAAIAAAAELAPADQGDRAARSPPPSSPPPTRARTSSSPRSTARNAAVPSNDLQRREIQVSPFVGGDPFAGLEMLPFPFDHRLKRWRVAPGHMAHAVRPRLTDEVSVAGRAYRRKNLELLVESLLRAWLETWLETHQ